MSAHGRSNHEKYESAKPSQSDDSRQSPDTPQETVTSGSVALKGATRSSVPAGDTKFFYILVADSTGRDLNRPAGDGKPPIQDPHDPKARQLAFVLKPEAKQSPPTEQMQIYTAAERIVHALSHLYPSGDPSTEARFRLFYVRVFHVARLALEAGSLGIEGAKQELAAIEKDLIDDEGPAIKNEHIKELLKWSAWFSLPALVAYAGLSYVRPGPGFGNFLRTVQVDPALLANFMLLWLGCFIGVCLSYTLRKPNFTVEDLVKTEADFLRPAIRLVFAGTLTMLLVMLAMVHVIDVSIGTMKLSSIAEGANGQMPAFLIGVLCGISELLLPAKIMGQKLS